MSFGTAINVSKDAGVGPIFVDVIDIDNDSAYTSGQGGSEGLQDKLRALRGDQRTIVSVTDCTTGAADTVTYNPQTGRLQTVVKSSGVEHATGDLSGGTLTLAIISK